MLLSFHGLKNDTGLVSAIPPKKLYKTTIFLGACSLDNIHVQDLVLTNGQIDTIYQSNQEQTWDYDHTILIADFEDTLEAGNLTNSDMPITSWIIRRRKSGSLIFQDVAEIPYDPTVSSYVDFTPRNNNEYEYAVYPVHNGTEGNPILGVGIVSFFGWTLSNLTGTTLFKFDMELDSGNLQTIRKTNIIENNTQYPVVSKGKSQYQTGSITCMPYEITNNEIDISLNVLESLETFINNNDVKILRNGKGQAWKVQCYDFSYKYLDKIASQPYSIQFSWVQVSDATA